MTRPAYSQLDEWYQVILKSFGSLCEIMVSPLAFYFDHLEKENCSCLNFLRFNLSNFNNNGKCYYINGSRRSRKTALAVINKEKKKCETRMKNLPPKILKSDKSVRKNEKRLY